MSAELCRVNLWLEALEPGKPLSFLDHHIRVGIACWGDAGVDYGRDSRCGVQADHRR